MPCRFSTALVNRASNRQLLLKFNGPVSLDEGLDESNSGAMCQQCSSMTLPSLSRLPISATWSIRTSEQDCRADGPTAAHSHPPAGVCNKETHGGSNRAAGLGASGVPCKLNLHRRSRENTLATSTCCRLPLANMQPSRTQVWQQIWPEACSAASLRAEIRRKQTKDSPCKQAVDIRRGAQGGGKGCTPRRQPRCLQSPRIESSLKQSSCLC